MDIDADGHQGRDIRMARKVAHAAAGAQDQTLLRQVNGSAAQACLAGCFDVAMKNVDVISQNGPQVGQHRAAPAHSKDPSGGRYKFLHLSSAVEQAFRDGVSSVDTSCAVVRSCRRCPERRQTGTA